MEKIKAAKIAEVTGGTLLWGDPETEITGISIDSRTITEGMAFFALKGERADGHDFLADAIRAGCAALVVEREDALSSDTVYTSATVRIKVKDAEQALQDLAAYYLSLFDIRKIGITGSTGKTTTKDMLFHILSEKYKTVRNQGNFNNLIGLPLSVFQVDRTTEAVVFEMGMDRLGEIHRLAEIVRPHTAVITNIGISHLEKLGSRENILKAKMEICDFMEEGNTLIMNGDDRMLSALRPCGAHSVFTVGLGENAELRISNLKDLGEKGIEFHLNSGEKGQKFHIGIPGLHNSMNAALAVAAALGMGVDMEQAASGLTKLAAADKRLNILQFHGIKIIDDSYNASPDSMKAALDVLASIKSTRKIAILGDMFELGEEEEKYHRQIGKYASQKGINVVLSVGKNAEHISIAAKEGGMQAFHFDNKDMLKSVLPQWIRKGDAILIKGSRGMAMDEIVRHLEETKE
jgi:UDP-N-acetylmuramoyl-tripeptide--D-alanyl-D-alanine ligase